MIDYTQILIENYPGKQWSLNGDSYEGLEWLEESQKPTKAELDALWESTQNKLAAKAQAEIDKKQASLDKLAALGLTADDLKNILG